MTAASVRARACAAQYYKRHSQREKKKSWNPTKRLRKLQRRIFSGWPLELLGEDGAEPGLIDRAELLLMVRKIGKRIDDADVLKVFHKKVQDMIHLHPDQLIDAPPPPKTAGQRRDVDFGGNWGYDRGPPRHHRGRPGIVAGQKPNKAAPAGRLRKCYNCGANGHTLRECPDPSRI